MEIIKMQKDFSIKNVNKIYLLLSFIITLSVYYFYFVIKSNGNVSSFIVAGDQYVDISLPIRVLKNQPGYDGQFYFGLAIDPFLTKNPSNGIYIDNPKYRQQRIIYPLLVHILSIGKIEFIPTMMVVVNLISVCVISLLAGVYCIRIGKNPLLSLLFSFFPGLFISFSRNLTEIVALTFFLAAILFIKDKNKSILFLSLTIFTRETTVILILTILFFAYKEKWRNWLYHLLPLLLYGLWQIYLFLQWGIENGQSKEIIDFPGKSLLQLLTNSIKNFDFNNLFSLSLLLVVFLLVLITFRTNKSQNFIRYSWILYFILGLSLSDFVWVEPYSFMRVNSEWYFLSIIIILNSPYSLSNIFSNLRKFSNKKIINPSENFK
jgi:hypothetical protein